MSTMAGFRVARSLLLRGCREVVLVQVDAARPSQGRRGRCLARSIRLFRTGGVLGRKGLLIGNREGEEMGTRRNPPEAVLLLLVVPALVDERTRTRTGEFAREPASERRDGTNNGTAHGTRTVIPMMAVGLGPIGMRGGGGAPVRLG